MTIKGEIYRCEICGNVVFVIEKGAGTLVCCGEEMKLIKASPPEMEGKEKHVPVIEIKEKKVTVKVGSVAHPMEEAHSIELIELLRNGKVVMSAMLYPGMKPEADFYIENTENLTARAYCNLHGLWASSS